MSPSDCFEAFDTDGNGTLTTGELAVGLRWLLSRATPATCLAVAVHVDADGDRSISKAEFVEAFAALVRAPPPAPPAASASDVRDCSFAVGAPRSSQRVDVAGGVVRRALAQSLSVPLGAFAHGSLKSPTHAKSLTLSGKRFRNVDLKAVRDTLFPKADNFRRLWEIMSGRTHLYIWTAVPPAGFVALGVGVTTGPEPPAAGAVRCVPAAWAVPATAKPRLLFDTVGMQGRKPGGIWRSARWASSPSPSDRIDMAPQASDFPPGRVPVHLTQFGGEFCLACLGYVGDTIVEKEEGGKVVYRVAAGSGLEPSAVAAIEAAVAPGAHYRFARRAAEEAASLKRQRQAREGVPDGRGADPEPACYGPDDDGYVARWALEGASSRGQAPARAESAAEAAARDGAVKAGLERLVDDSEKVFAEALLDVCVGDDLGARRAYGGVALLRAPGDEDDRTDLEVMAWKAYERAGGVSGAGMCDAVTFWETILATRARRRNAGYPPERVPACPPWTPPGDPAPHLGFGDRPPRPAVDLGDGSAVRFALEAACGRADGADGGAVVFACRFRDRGRSGVSVGIARADDDGALDLVVSLGGDVVTRRRLKRAPEASALALDVAHDRNDAVDGRWELRAACYAATAADYKDGACEIDYAAARGAAARRSCSTWVPCCGPAAARSAGSRRPRTRRPSRCFGSRGRRAPENAGDSARALASLKVLKNSIALKAARFDRSAAETSTGWQQALRAVVRPKWPLDALLFDDAAPDYQAAFSRLLAARKAADDLDARDGVEPTWRRFVDRLGAASDFAEVKAAHRAFILDLRNALLLGEDAVHGALDDVFLDAARLARLLDAHEDDLEDLPASALARLRGDFSFHADTRSGACCPRTRSTSTAVAVHEAGPPRQSMESPPPTPRPRSERRQRAATTASRVAAVLPLELVSMILVNVADAKRHRWRFVHADIAGMRKVRLDLATHWVFLNDASYDNPHALPWKMDYEHAERLPLLIPVD
ncbi:hypothetical protein JL722_14615 [Aureococcus anophagefferens]|nr:hypothetical protein JL722_14615 [Aureococcus anophagefferens]